LHKILYMYSIYEQAVYIVQRKGSNAHHGFIQRFFVVRTYRPYVGIDIDLNVGDIRHPTSTSVIPISETNMSD
jgi:hypothetical protein